MDFIPVVRYACLAEDRSAWLVVEDGNGPGRAITRQWVRVLGMGQSEKEAWADYEVRKVR